MNGQWLVLAGPTRTGTTSLFRHLLPVASLRASRRKETDYFRHCLLAGTPADPAEYRRLFAPGSGRCMEASPLYFSLGTALAEQLAALPGDVKVLFTLREPVARFRSLLVHVQTKRNVDDPPDAGAFVAAALAAAENPANVYDENLLAFREGCYRDLLGEWVAVLGEARVRVIFFESLKAEPQPVLRELYTWLALPPQEQPPLVFAQENAAREVRSRQLHGTAMRLNAWLEPVLNRLQPLRVLLRNIYYAINGSTVDEPLPPALARQLQQAYALRNAGLRQQVQALTLGPLPAWVE